MKQEYSIDSGMIAYRIRKAKELISENKMRGQTLSNCLASIAYFDCESFVYPLSLDEFSNFVQSWIDQNGGIWKFHTRDLAEISLHPNLNEKQYTARTLREFLEASCNKSKTTKEKTHFNLPEIELAKKIRYKLALFQGIDLHRD